MDFAIRDARDDDAWDLIGLVAGCWSEYPGCVLDVHGEVPELLTIASSYAGWGGRFWVVHHDRHLAASIGMRPAHEPGTVLLQKLYVAQGMRRQGMGRRLVELVEDEALSRRARRVELWTDTRFISAHRLYEACGYQRTPQTRDLRDLSNTTEYRYTKLLG